MEKRTVVKKSFNRVKKSGIIVIGVSLVYYIYDCKKISLEFNIVVFVKRVIEGPMSNCLWYMYIGILLILPVLQKMTKPMKKQDYMYIFHNRIVFSELMYDQRPSYSLMKSFILVLLLENVRVPITVKKASLSTILGYIIFIIFSRSLSKV